MNLNRLQNRKEQSSSSVDCKHCEKNISNFRVKQSLFIAKMAGTKRGGHKKSSDNQKDSSYVQKREKNNEVSFCDIFIFISS